MIFIAIFLDYILSGWWFGTWLLWLSIQLGNSSSQLTNSHFQRGRYTTNHIYIWYIYDIYIYIWYIYIYIYYYIYDIYIYVYDIYDINIYIYIIYVYVYLQYRTTNHGFTNGSRADGSHHPGFEWLLVECVTCVDEQKGIVVGQIVL